jgi:cytochrome b561
MNAALRYTRTAQGLHWALAIMILGMVGLGFYMHDLPLSPRKLQLYSWHKWAGVTVFLLVVVRLAWRATHPAPPLPATTSRPVAIAAHAAHALLYVLMLALPLSGWLMSSAKGFQTVWFGVLPLPDLLSKDAALGERLADLHEALAIALLALVGLHVAGALKHHFVDRDGLLARMWPARTREERA